MAGEEAGFHEGAEEAHTWRSGLNSGKLDRQAQPHQPPTQPTACPECGSQRIWKNGLRYTNRGEIQRYICRACGYRFSETIWSSSDPPEHVQKIHRKLLNSAPALPFNRQVCVTETQGAKNLAEVESRIEKWAAGATKPEIKGKIVEFAWWLKKQGYKMSTIKVRVKALKWLIVLGADILNPESVKDVIAKKESWDDSTKGVICVAYESFLTMHGLAWKKPRYKGRGSLPFIPLESEIDALINACGKVTGTFLQGLKDTGADPGELAGLRWIDINFEAKSVTINHPVKGHDARVIPVSDEFLRRLSVLPRKGEKVFSSTDPYATFYSQRKTIARKLNNLRIEKISFRTLRHWKGTMEYHKTHDPKHVQKLLGHKQLTSTQIYINLEQAIFDKVSDEFHVSVAHNLQEACDLVKIGFEYVTEMDGGKIFKKRK